MTDMAIPQVSAGLGERMWRAYAPLAALWLVYFTGLKIALAPFGTELVIFPLRFVPMYALGIGGFITLWFVVLYARFISYGRLPPRERWQRLTGHVRWTEALGPGSIPPIFFIFTTMSMFAAFKPHIPDFNAFTWDPTFIEWDRALFFGHDGWEVTHAVFGAPWMTLLIDRFYLAWFLVVLLAACVAAFSPMLSRMRMAFLMTFALNWIIGGTLLAIVFSSVGPVFMDRLSGDQTFIPLLERLRAADEIYTLWTSNGIEMLWLGYIKDPNVVEFGISAFPSLHVCMSMLVVFYAQHLGRVWGMLAWGFLVLIVIGSVHLGWHYLVDGLAGMAICWANWRASLWFARWWLKEEA